MQSEHRISTRTSVLVLLIPALCWTAWLTMMNSGDRWSLFSENWFMTVTMCVGSFIAGATSEGGGAVAFPVMTLIFKIEPTVARDFSLMIQSVGMTAAALTIVLLRIPVEWRAVSYAGLGGAFGIVIGLEFIAPLIPAAYVKMFFTSLWLSFAVALLWINQNRDRVTHQQIEGFQSQHAISLIAIGFLGGIVSSLTGSGIDVVTFTLLTLFFRLNEKVATPTSVILMAGNALVGFLWSGAVQHRLTAEAWDYWYVCVPVVIVGAPLGAWFINKRTRHFIARFLYISIFIQYLVALYFVPQSPPLAIFSIATIGCGVLLFRLMAIAGNRSFNRSGPQ